MAEAGPNVGFATLSIVPSLRGVESAIAGQLAPVEAAGATAGAKAGAGFASKFGDAIKFGLKAGPIAAVVAIGVGAVASAKSFEEAQNTIIRATGATGAAADALEQSFKNVAKTTPASFETVATALSEVAQRTGLSGTALETFTRQVVTFNRITKDAPVNVQDLTKALAGFGVPADKLSENFDALFKASQRTGVPLDQLVATLQKSGPIVRQFGIPIGEATTFLTQLDKAGVEAGPIVAGLRSAFVKFAKEGKEPGEALKGTIKEIQNLIAAGDLAGARKIGVQLFGARGSGLVDAAIQGKLSLDGLSSSLETAGDGILETAKRTSTIAGKFGVLKNNIALALAPLGKPLLDAANAGLGAIVKLVQNAGSVIGPILNSVGDAFKTISEAFTNGGTGASGAIGVFEQIGVAARSLVDFFVKNWPLIASVVGDTFDRLVDAFKPVAAAFREAAPPIISLAKDGLKVLAIAAGAVGLVLLKTIVPAFKILLPVIGQVLAAIIKFTGFLAKDRAVLAAFLGPIAAVAAAFAAYSVAMKVAAVVTKVFAVAQGILNAVLAANPIVLIALAIGALAAAFVLAYQKIQPFHDAVDAVGRALKSAFEFVARNWKLLGALLLGPIAPFIAAAVLIVKNWQTVVDFFKGLGQTVADALNAFIDSGFASAIVDYITNTFDNIVQVVQGALDIVIGIFNIFKALFTGDWQGLWDGIKQVVEGVWAVIGGIIQQGITFVTAVVRIGFEALKSTVGKVLDDIVQFFIDLPGRLLDLVTDIANAGVAIGKAIVQGIVDGIKAVAGFASDLAEGVGNSIVHIINTILDKVEDAVNAGLELADKAAGPFINFGDISFPRIKGFETGGIVPGPIGQPMLAVVHGGEEVRTVEQQQAAGTTINVFGRSDDDMLRKLAIEQRRQQVLAG